jgi:hypothetical protein
MSYGVLSRDGATAPRARNSRRRSASWWAAGIFAAMFLIYNANGREIASYDSQPPKFTAVEIARYHTTRLDTDIVRSPALAERPAFARDRQGHWRSAYPPLPGLIAGIVAILLRLLGANPGAPLMAPLVAKLTASALTAMAVSCAFLVAARETSRIRALLVALGFGLGTGLWSLISQTLWQSETTVAALTAVVCCLGVAREDLSTGRLWLASLLLGLAGAARAQLAPAIVIVGCFLVWRRRRLADVLALTPLVAIAAVTLASNQYWFGNLLGARGQLEAAATQAHAVAGSLGNPLAGAAGLLCSPSRGLLIYSPIVLVVLGAFRAGPIRAWRDDLRWFGLAAVVQFWCYASYSAWWGGHTYGPRLALDVLPFLLPHAAIGVAWVCRSRLRAALATALLVWSVVLAGTGAFVYPHERWNSDPVDVDRNHDRLWDWRDPQFGRAWAAGPCPQNFVLFTRDTIRRPRL